MTPFSRSRYSRGASLLAVALASASASAIEDADAPAPTLTGVRYGTGQEVMDLYLAPSEAPTPVYLYGHASGQDYKIVPRSSVRACLAAGISFISLEANDADGTVGFDLRSPGPWLRAIDHVRLNAERYNVDADNLFIGGRSLGSIGSFPASLRRWRQVRGVYSAQAVPRVGAAMATLVHGDAPPCHFVFKLAPGANNHDPRNGESVRDAYAALGIGDRFSMVTEAPVGTWFDGLVGFVGEHRRPDADPGGLSEVADRDPARFAGAIRRFERSDLESSPPRGGVVIVGSSSVRRLDAERVFPGVELIQRGFGGAHVPDVVHYAETLVFKHEPSTVVFFCGGNDLGVGHSVDRVEEDFREFAAALFRRLPRCRLVTLAVRPSPKRRRILDKVLELNARLENFAKSDERIVFLRGSCDRFLGADGEPIASMYADDRQHMNDDGYAVWTEILAPYLAPYRRDPPVAGDTDRHE